MSNAETAGRGGREEGGKGREEQEEEEIVRVREEQRQRALRIRRYVSGIINLTDVVFSLVLGGGYLRYFEHSPNPATAVEERRDVSGLASHCREWNPISDVRGLPEDESTMIIVRPEIAMFLVKTGRYSGPVFSFARSEAEASEFEDGGSIESLIWFK